MQLIVFAFSAFLSTKTKKVALLASVMGLLLLCIFYPLCIRLPPLAAMTAEKSTPYALLYLLSVAFCVSIAFRYLKTIEYQFLRSLPTMRCFHLFAITLRTTYVILAFTALSVVFLFHCGICPFVSLFYSPIVLLATSSIIMHTLYFLLHKAKRSPLVMRLLQCGSLMLLVALAAFWYRIDVRVFDFNSSFFIKGIHKLLTPNAFIFLICLGWLITLCLLDRPYEYLVLNPSRKRGEKAQAVYRGLYRNQLFKDSLIAKTKPTYLVISCFYLAVGVYCAKFRFNASVCIVISVIFSVILSTISEELIANDVPCMPLLYSFPISLKKLFWAKIGSVCTLISLPSLVFLLIVVGFSTFTVGSFVFSITTVICVSSLFSSMQCMIVLSSALTAKSSQFTLFSSVIISFMLPIFPIFYLCLYGKKAQNNFCGGRE